MIQAKHSRALLLIRNGLIIIVASVLLFILCEVVIRHFWPQDTNTIGPESLAIKDSLLEHRLRPNSRAVVTGPEFTFEYEIDKDGLRDESNHLSPKPSGLIRILLLGDSMTFGFGNSYDKIWPVIFERKLLETGYNVDVVKAGVPGYDTRQEVLYLERIFAKYNPDTVVLTFLSHDLFSNLPISNNESLETLRPVNQNNAGIGARDDKRFSFHSATLATRLLISNDLLYSLLYLITPRAQFFTLPMNNKLQQQINITKDLMSRASHYCRAKGADFIVLSIPQQFQVIVKAHNYKFGNTDVDFIDEVFSEFAAKEGFIWIPALEALAEKYPSDKNHDLYFRLDGHLNNYGNYSIGDYFSVKFIDSLQDRLNTQNQSEQGD